MFEVGFWELVVILVLVLVVAGPERMPAIVRTLGLLAGRAKAMAGNLRAEFEREIHADELRQAARAAQAAAHDLTAEPKDDGRPHG